MRATRGAGGVRRAPGVCAAAAALLLAAAPAAAELRFEASAGGSALRGHTTYAIGGAFTTPAGPGHTNDPLSELAFPLDVTLATLAVEAAAPLRRGTLVVSGEFARSLTGDAGTMVDRDWTSPLQPGLPTVYAEAGATLDATVVDLRVRWRLLELDGPRLGASPGGGGAWLAVGAGYLWEKFDFTAADVRQLATAPERTGTRAGPVLAYEALHRVPYAELSAGVGLAAPPGIGIAVEARVGASPWARADDVDDHLLRAKRAEGDCAGTAVLAGVRARLEAGRVFLAAAVSHVAVDASGTQTQERYADTAEGPAGPIGSIDQTITSAQTRYDLALGVRF